MSDRARVLGAEIDRLDIDQTLARCEQLIEAGGPPAQHVAINAAKLIRMREHPHLREVIERCELVSADGQPIVWASRLLGDPLPGRVCGFDLMERLIERAEVRGWRIYFLGARQEVLDRAIARLRERHPRLIICGSHHGYFDDESDDGEAVREDIRRASPHVLFVAISTPRKEFWLGTHLRDLGVPFGMGVGGSIDVVAGLVRRAPRWTQRAGLEWLVRLVQEPRRLARRYVVTNTAFLLLLSAAVVRTRVLRRPA